MNLLTSNPVSFINAATPFQANFVIFCATWLGIITIAWTLLYILVRPIPNKCILAPFENIRDRMLHLAIIVLAVVIAYFASVVLKNYFQIGRPVLLNFDLHPLLHLTNYGFPSSHAAVYSALAASLFLTNERAGAFATLLVLILGTARIFAGVHTPLDIIGGYLLGVLAAIVIDFVAQVINNGKETEAHIHSGEHTHH